MSDAPLLTPNGLLIVAPAAPEAAKVLAIVEAIQGAVPDVETRFFIGALLTLLGMCATAPRQKMAMAGMLIDLANNLTQQAGSA